MRIALFQPDIPQNTGAILRLCACFGAALDIIEPCGFPLSDTGLKRAGMDYIGLVSMTRHESFAKFLDFRKAGGHRLIALSTKATQSYADFAFKPGDILLLGRESAGLPPEAFAACDDLLKIPMAPKARSLNVAMAGAVVLAEALRQTGQLPQLG